MAATVGEIRGGSWHGDAPARARTWARRCAAWLLLSLAVMALQWRSGTYRADLSSTPDEAAHAVSALLIHDYAAALFPAHPLRFAERFYVHYPKVAIGHWPPALHALLACWMLLFGRTKAAMLMFLALTGMALGIGIYEMARRECGELGAIACALMFSTAPVIQGAVSSVMPDLLLGAVVFAGAAAYGEWLESGERRYRLWFAAAAFFAIAIHGRGIVVLLVPIFASMGPALKKVSPKRALLGGAAAIALVSAPILLGQSLPVSAASIARNAAMFPLHCAMQFRWAGPLLAVISLVQLKSGRLRAMAALVAANWFFFSVVNLYEDRYLLTAAPAIFVLAAKGWRVVADRQGPRASLALTLLAAVVVAVNTIPGHEQPDLGYATAIAKLPRLDHVSLVAGDFEGAYIAAMALHDGRLDHIVLRGSKMLARSSWAGGVYEMTVSGDGEIDLLLQKMSVGTVIVQEPSLKPHVRLLEHALEHNPAWREVAPIALGARVFQIAVPPAAAPLRIRIENPGGFHTSFEFVEP